MTNKSFAYIGTSPAAITAQHGNIVVAYTNGNDAKTISYLKVHSIIIGAADVTISSAAIALAMKHQIEIVLLNDHEQPYARLWHCQPGNTAALRSEQLKAAQNGRGITWACQWLAKQINNRVQLLTQQGVGELTNQIEQLQQQGQQIAQYTQNNNTPTAEVVQELKATADAHYFKALTHTVPPNWSFKGRSLWPAKDPFNALLNYANAFITSSAEKALVIAGLDPYTGFLHPDNLQLLSLVNDFAAPYLVYAEAVVLQLLNRDKGKGNFTTKDYQHNTEAGCQLMQSGKNKIAEAMRAYLHKDVTAEGYNRATGIQLAAHRLAEQLQQQNEANHAHQQSK